MSGAAAEALTPTELRVRVLSRGWHPLPVVGKAPTPTDWTRFCRSAPTFDEVTFWGRSHPGAISTGLALGQEVGIDIDVASNPLLAEAVRAIAVEVFGSTPFERVGRAPKVALLYRAAADVVSSSHKAVDGSGDGIDVLADGRQVVAFGRHKDTGLPYTWVGAASPLDAGPEAAPVITAAQVDEFLLRVEAVMPMHGGGAAGGARRGSGGGPRNGVVRGVSGLVVDGREEFLTGCVWRAANALHQAGVDLTQAAVTNAAWDLFSDPADGADLEDGRWEKGAAAYKVRATLRRIEAGTVALGARLEHGGGEKLDPTYPDNSVTVGEARAAAHAAIEIHFAAGTGHRALRVGTGIGKTRAAARAIADDIQRRRAAGDRSAALFLTPTLALADEVAELLRSEGIVAKVFRGRKAPDPDAPDTGRLMCLDPDVVDLATNLGRPVGESCCKGKHPKTGTKVFCPLFNHCSYQRQLLDQPDAWVGAHDLLFSAHGGLGEIGSITVDEGFAETGLRIGKRGVTLDDLGSPPALGSRFEDYALGDVAAWRSTAAAALRRQERPGGMERRHLVEGGVTVEMCAKANAAEWRIKDKVRIWPGMPKVSRQVAMDGAGAGARLGAFSGVWKAARELLEQDDENAVSGRLVLFDKPTADGFGTARAVLTHSVRPVLERWLDKPILVMDATLPGIEILRQFLPDIEVVADVQAKAPHARVRQVVGAPVSKRKLHGSAAGRNREAVRRALLLRWVELGRPSALVVAQKETVEWLREVGLPEGIATGHYGALAGLDGFKSVGWLVAIGRRMPTPFEVETTAGAFTGLEPRRTAEPEKGARFHDRVPLALRMADGSGHPVEGYRHPDPLAEAARWRICEGELVQAIGRCRGVNRAAENPVQVEIWSDVCLPITIDEVAAWGDVPAGYEADMLADGVGVESAPDMAACWPAVWETEQAAKRWRQKLTGAPNPIRGILYKGWGTCGRDGAPSPRPAAFRYQHEGARQKWRLGWYAPDVVADPCAWLEQRLGTPLPGFEYLPDAEGESTAEHQRDEGDAA